MECEVWSVKCGAECEVWCCLGLTFVSGESHMEGLVNVSREVDDEFEGVQASVLVVVAVGLRRDADSSRKTKRMTEHHSTAER